MHFRQDPECPVMVLRDREVVTPTESHIRPIRTRGAAQPSASVVAEKGLDVRLDTARERMQVVSALERRYDAAFGCPVGQFT